MDDFVIGVFTFALHRIINRKGNAKMSKIQVGFFCRNPAKEPMKRENAAEQFYECISFMIILEFALATV